MSYDIEILENSSIQDSVIGIFSNIICAVNI